MPVLYLGRNVNHISRVQFLSGFAPLLIITPTRRTKKDLTAVMVDVPVVPAINWTPYSQSLVVTGFNGIHVCALCGNWAQRSHWKQARPCRLKGRDNWPR